MMAPATADVREVAPQILNKFRKKGIWKERSSELI